MDISLILIPVDFTECSANALSYGKKLAPLLKAELLLIHVIDSREAENVSAYIKEPVEQVRERLMNQAKQSFRRFLSKWDGGDMIKDTIVSYGRPFQEIAIKARELQVDLVLMGGYGSQGKGQLDEIFFGSTVEKVVRLLPCPVMCVPMGWSTEERT